MLGAGTAPGDKGMPMRLCVIAAYPIHPGDTPDFALLRQELHDWAGVPPRANHDTADFVEFAFKAGPKDHLLLPQPVDPLAVDGPWPDGVVVVMLSSIGNVVPAGPFRTVSYMAAGP